MFLGCSNLTSLDLSGFDTSNVTDMDCMFCDCSSLTTLDLSNFDTSNINTMSYVFSGCSNLTSLDLSGFDTSNVTDMRDIFRDCSNLATLDLRSFDTSNVTDMRGMFSNCSRLTTLDVSRFDTSNVTDMNDMFCDCSNLATLDLRSFETSNVTDMCGMFCNCSSLTTLDVSCFDTSNVTNMPSMFRDCSSLTSLDLGNFDTFNVTSMYYMFADCSSLTSLDLSNFDISKVQYMDSLFSGCVNLTSLDLSSFDTSKVQSTSKMFDSCNSLAMLKTPRKNTIDVLLPITMFDITGVQFTSLPKLSKSITLTRSNPLQPGKIETLFPTDNDRTVDRFTSFGIVWDKSIQYTGIGSAYLYKYDTDQLVQTIPLRYGDAENSSILSYGSNLDSHNLLLLNFDSTLLEHNTHYYILIDAGALEFCELDESISDYVSLGITMEGINGKDDWDFTTNNYQYMNFSNPTDRIPLSICSVLFRPITAKRFYDKEKGTHGTCYGMVYTAGAYARSYFLLSELCAGRDLSELDKDASTEGVPYTLLEYIQLAYMYQYTSAKQDEYYGHKDKYDKVYNAIVSGLNGGTPVQISVSDANDNGHVLLPLSIIKNDDSLVEILVYDCNKPSPLNDIFLSSYISTLKLYRSGDTFIGFSYGDYTSISYEEIDTTLDSVASMAEPEIWSEQKTLVVSGLKILDDGFRKIFSADDEQEQANDGKYYYWTDDASLELPASENGTDISMTDGYKEVHVVSSAGTSVSIDLDSQSATVTSDKNEKGPLLVSLSTADGESDIKNITLSGNANTQITVMPGSNGIVLTSMDSNFNDMSVTVDGNDVELNTADFTSLTNSVTVKVDEDNTIIVTEDTDEDGENETTLVQKEAGDAAIVYAASLTLEGQIGVNIKLILPESVTSDPDAYVVMGYSGEKEVSITTPVSEAAMDSGRYVFTCPVAVKEINDPVSICVYHGDGSQVELVKGEISRIPVEENCFRYAVSDYIASKKTKTTAIGELVRTMSDFGAAARLYFDYEADGSVIEADLSGITADDLLEYKMELTSQAAEGIKIYGASLMLESETGINIKFAGTSDTFDINDYTFTVDGAEVTPTAAADGRYQISIGNIAAKDLDRLYTVTVTDSAGNSQSIRYGALSYVYSKLNSSSSGESIRNLSKCLYLYNQAANSYFND